MLGPVDSRIDKRRISTLDAWLGPLWYDFGFSARGCPSERAGTKLHSKRSASLNGRRKTAEKERRSYRWGTPVGVSLLMFHTCFERAPIRQRKAKSPWP